MTIIGTTKNIAFSEASNGAATEIDYVLACFDHNFSKWKGKKIVIHGVREYAQAILETFDKTYRFSAIASQAEDAGDKEFSKDVWTNERMIEEHPDLVILTERVRHAEVVYQEIGEACRTAGIALFDMYGIDWLAMRDEIDKQFAITIEQLAEIAAPYDAVSFEVPDCLMMVNPLANEAPLMCRPHMKRFIRILRSQGKKTIFIGRKPWSAEEQLRSLEAESLVLSHEENGHSFFMRTGEDGAWRSIRMAYPNARILHLGYGIAKECVLPRYYGVDTYRIVGEPAKAIANPILDRRVAEALNPQMLKQRIYNAFDQAIAVSFDVFDTLVMRTTLSPVDIYEIVEQRAIIRGIPAEGFAAVRSAAQFNAANYTVEQVYLAVQKALGYSNRELDALYEIELEVERMALVPREPMCAMFRQALESGKRVFLVTDMHHSAETLADLLSGCGIRGYERIIVSSEFNVLKRHGLFDFVVSSEIPADRIVHIGDSIVNDIEPAEEAGMQAVLVPAALDLALAHGVNRTMKKDITLTERNELGLKIATDFADPFEERGIALIEGLRVNLSNSDVARFTSLRSNSAFLEKALLHASPFDKRIPNNLRKALLAWYPFPNGERALFFGLDHEAFVPLLEPHFKKVDFTLQLKTKYDCIVVIDPLEGVMEIEAFMKRIADALLPSGVVIVGFRNRFGIKYLCGGIDAAVTEPFATLDSERKPGSYGKTEMQRVLSDAGLQDIRTYYVMPDSSFTQAIYTDDFIPGGGIHDRVMPFDAYESPLLANERVLYSSIVEEGMLPAVANYFLMECRKPAFETTSRNVVHAALSLDREVAHAFVTTLFDDGTAIKQAAYPEGRTTLATICANDQTLRAHGLATVGAQLDDRGLIMPLVKEIPLLEYLNELLPLHPDEFIAVFDQLYRDILASSDPGTLTEADARTIWHEGDENLKPILQTGYIDMVPYNAFWTDGKIRYFDQEFTVQNCPAKYILFRALRYTWIHLPHAETVISLDSLKKCFGLERLWDSFMHYEHRFVEKNRNLECYRDIYAWANTDAHEIAKRRNVLVKQRESQYGKPYGIGLLMGVFDLFHVGHLRLINRAKARCRFLRVAVLADNVVQQFKGITPTIPLAQRMEILSAIDEVDEVVAIHDDPSRIKEYERRPFDCFFSGDDYAGNDYWEQERRVLNEHGATIEFFPYTEEQSSTRIRQSLESMNDLEAS